MSKHKSTQKSGCSSVLIGAFVGAFLGLVAPFIYSMLTCSLGGCSAEGSQALMITSVFYSPFSVFMGAFIGLFAGLFRA